jgi:hypothetical protein
MDRNRHMATRTPSTPLVSDRVIERFPASHPRGSWPAEEFAAARRAEGINATVVMDLATDTFLVKAVTV